MQGVKRAEVEHVKAFASRTHDRARPAYGRGVIDQPRRCVLIGTTNADTYLKSQTGNRRFWPVKTGVINLDALRRDRDQLWAEAAAVEATGVSLVLPRELWAHAKMEQDARLEYDPWRDILENMDTSTFPDNDGGKEQRIATTVILTDFLKIAADKQSTGDAARLKGVMNKLGWSGPDLMYFGAKRLRGYRRAVT
jgi:predicted P-loop ATPase